MIEREGRQVGGGGQGMQSGQLKVQLPFGKVVSRVGVEQGSGEFAG